MDKPEKSNGPVLWFITVLLTLILGIGLGYYILPNQNGKNTASKVSATVTESGGPAITLKIGENAIADIAEAAAPSVVNIDTRTSLSMPRDVFHNPQGFRNFEFFFGPGMHGMPQQPRRFESRGSGSGVIVRNDGYILTNNHVVRNASEIKVTLNDKRVFIGKVVGRDSFTDLALVKIEVQDLPVVRFGASKSLRPGDWAIAIGSPLGLDHTVTLGIVSALGRSVADLNNNVELIQTDAAINPGNSGGPLLNIHGEVIGINTAIRSDAQNIGFAIPIDSAKDVITQLLAGGSIKRPYVGVYMQELDEKLARSLGLSKGAAGVVVAQVASGSPANQAGLQQGDVIERVDGQPVKSSKEVQGLVRGHKVGETVNMLVLRNGKLVAAQIKVGDYPAEGQIETQPNGEEN